METEITIHNETELKVQAQIYSGRMLISTCVVNPGKVQILPGNSLRFDIFFKNGATGWEIARKLDSDANNFTLSKYKNRYTVVGTIDNDPHDLVMEFD